MSELRLVNLDLRRVAESFEPERLHVAFQALIKLQDLPGARKMLEAATPQERESGKLEYLQATLYDRSHT